MFSLVDIRREIGKTGVPSINEITRIEDEFGKIAGAGSGSTLARLYQQYRSSGSGEPTKEDIALLFRDTTLAQVESFYGNTLEKTLIMAESHDYKPAKNSRLYKDAKAAGLLQGPKGDEPKRGYSGFPEHTGDTIGQGLDSANPDEVRRARELDRRIRMSGQGT